jgi:hypothetical protein
LGLFFWFRPYFRGILVGNSAYATSRYIEESICQDDGSDREYTCGMATCEWSEAADTTICDGPTCEEIFERNREQLYSCGFIHHFPPDEDDDDCISPTSFDYSPPNKQPQSHYLSPYLQRVTSNQNPPVCDVPTPTICDYDDTSVYNTNVPNRNLNDKHLNPEMKRALDAALNDARQAGFKVMVGEAYRSPERSEQIRSQGITPAGAWASAHNYGIAVDILLVNSAGKIIPNNNNGDYKRFTEFMKAEGFEWYGDYGSGDDGHFEYHPAITGLLDKNELKAAREKAIKEMGLTDVRCAEWWTQFWQNMQNTVSRQPLSSGDNLESNEASDPGFVEETNEEQSEEEELREEIEDDVDECDLNPDDPWCASLRAE